MRTIKFSSLIQTGTLELHLNERDVNRFEDLYRHVVTHLHDAYYSRHYAYELEHTSLCTPSTIRQVIP